MSVESIKKTCKDTVDKHYSSILRFGPPIVVEIGWWIWALMEPEARFGLFSKPTPFVGNYYYMSCTMVFGSMVAGATSEGGGAIAFPVMTLLLGVPPLVARDFSFAIQSFGMTVASITIFGLRVPLDYEGLIWGSCGGTVGLIFGLALIAPHLPPAYAKLFFVSVFMTFAVALFKLNSQGRDRRVYKSALESDQAIFNGSDLASDVASSSDEENAAVEAAAQNPDEKVKKVKEYESAQKQKRTMVLFGTGFCGGICSSIAGSGLDITSFSVLTLFYRVSEKVATPTSVVLMAINAIVGTICRLIGLGGAYAPGQQEAVWNFVAVCVPIVVIGAPLGATISARLPRHWLAYLIYILDTIQFVSAIAIIQPWTKPNPHNIGLCVMTLLTLILGSLFFIKISDLGNYRGEVELKGHKEIDGAIIEEATSKAADTTTEDSTNQASEEEAR